MLFHSPSIGACSLRLSFALWTLLLPLQGRAFYQALWFRAACWGIFLLAVFTIYQLRLRIATERVRGLLAERLAERERTARELHDTLLQGVQGLILLFQSIAFQLPPDSPLLPRMESAIERAERLIAEDRDSIRTICLRVPANVAYRKPLFLGVKLFHRLQRIFGSDNE